MKSLNSYINEKFQVPKDYKNPYNEFDEYGDGEIIKSNNVMYDLFKLCFGISLHGNDSYELNMYLPEIGIPVNKDVVLYHLTDYKTFKNKQLSDLMNSKKSKVQWKPKAGIQCYFYQFANKDISMILMERDEDYNTEIFLYLNKS